VERLDHYWDESPRGAAEYLHDLDPALVDTVRQLRALHRPPAIDPAFQRRLEAQFFDAPAAPAPWPGPWRRYRSDPAARPTRNGHVPSHASNPPHATPTRRGWRPVPQAAAAALALALIGSLLVLRVAAPPRDARILDAAHAPAVETFVDAVVENPGAEWTPLVVERWTFQPGVAALTIPALTGPQWIVAEGSGLVVSIGGAEQDLATGAGLVVPPGQGLVMRNTGPGPSSALRGVAEARYVLEDYDRSAIIRQTALDTEAHEALPPGASHVVFERLTLLAGTTLLLEPATGQDWLGVASGRLGVTLLGKRLPLNWQSGREREIAVAERLPALVPGTKVALRNVGDEPLVLLRLRVMSVASGAGASP
jgi:hypothetical protein